MEILSTDIKLLAFYEIARRANLTDDPNLVNWPAFQRGKELYEQRAKYMWEAFGSRGAIDNFVKLHIGGILSTENKSWEDIWIEFAPDVLKRFPLAPGNL
jgi:hypothetical protein